MSIQVRNSLNAFVILAIKEEKGMAILIALDAGHGSNTAGKRTPKMHIDTDLAKAGEQIREHTANVWVCKYAADYLKKYGFDVYKSAWDDTNTADDPDVPLNERQTAIRRAKATVSVSCHFNAYGNGNSFNASSGIETLISVADYELNGSRSLAEEIQERLCKLGRKDRGVKRADLAMCKSKYMQTEASVLCELGFMTNKDEAVLMGSKKYLKDCGHYIALGIYDFLTSKPKKTITSRNAKRDQILWLQVKLNLKGHQTPATGVWDKDTIKSVQAFWLEVKKAACTGRTVSEECIRLLSTS